MRTALEYYQSSLARPNKDGKPLADAGPVTLGFRLSSSKFPSGYEEVAYGRGTWLIHMVREMMRSARCVISCAISTTAPAPLASQSRN